MKERVQKLMAQANLGSRRACEEIIRAGRVRVNGAIIHLGDQADPKADTITIDGVKLTFAQIEKRYYALNKPINVLSDKGTNYTDDRSTVRELIPAEGHLFAIGRLDAESEGLMVLTNDGEMVNRLTHPRYEHTKTYKVVVYGEPSAETLAEWQNGVFLEDGKTAPCYIRVMEKDKAVTTLRIIMTEGKKRQIRRVAAQLGHPVKRLVRTHIGQLELGTLRQGEWIELTAQDVTALQRPAPELELIRKRRQLSRQIRGKLRSHRAASTDAEPPTEKKHRRAAPHPATGRTSRPATQRRSRQGDAPSRPRPKSTGKPTRKPNPRNKGESR